MNKTRLLVDGGGTSTRAAIWHNGDILASTEQNGPSCNPRSIDGARAVDNLHQLLDCVWRNRPASIDSLESAWLCISTASSLQSSEQFARQLLERPTAPLYAAEELWIINDVAPLLVHDGRLTDRAVVNCGTGTGFCAINPTKELIARASGKEYLLADEGGGFDL